MAGEREAGDLGSTRVEVTDLGVGSEGAKLSRPITFEVEGDGFSGFVASFLDVDMWADGETLDAAVATLKTDLYQLWQELEKTPDDELTIETLRWKELMRELVLPRTGGD